MKLNDLSCLVSDFHWYASGEVGLMVREKKSESTL